MAGHSLDIAEIAPRLWIGAAPPVGDHVYEAGFDTLVLCAVEYQPPSDQYPGVQVLHAPFRDAEDVGAGELKLAEAAAEWTANQLVEGSACLVTCMAGRNRSGIVCALALSLAARVDPARAGEIVRRGRGDIALTNARFVSHLNAVRGDDCDLCKAERVTARYHEDSLCWIADCASCGCPMVVMRRHSTNPNPQERADMINLLKGAAIPGVRYRLDTERNSIPSHWHAHLRPLERT